MGLNPDTSTLIAQLMGMVKSPRVQYGVGNLKKIIPTTGGPFGGTQLPSNNQTGASQSFRRGTHSAGTGLGGRVGSFVSQLNGQQAQSQDPLMNLYEQLLSQLQQPVAQPPAIDTEALMGQVRKAIDPIYDQRAQAAQGQSDRARTDVKGMYGALADDYERLAPEQIAQAKDAQDQIKALYGQLRSNIEGTYSRVSDEQGDLFKQLGIESALPEVLEDQQAAVTDASMAANENQAQQQQRYMDIGQEDSTYYREGSPIATMAGNEISTDMLGQLQNYLQQVEAERTSGIQTAYSDQLGQAQSNLAQQQQSAQSEAGRRQEMLWSMLQSQLSGNNQAQALTSDSFMGQLPQQIQQSVAGAFTQLQRSPEAVYGKVQDPRNPVPGTFVDTNPEWYMAQADKMLQEGQIDATTHAALLQYLQLYYKTGQ